MGVRASRDQRATRGWPRAPEAASLPTSSLLLLAGLAAAAVAQGGFYGRGQLLLELPSSRGGRRSLLVRAAAPLDLVGLALAAWCVVDGLLTHQDGLRTAALPLAVVAVAQLVERLDAGQRDALLTGLLGLGAVLAAVGLLAVVAHQLPWAHHDQGLWRAATTLTYENAAGSLLAVLSLVGLSGRHRAPTALLVAGTLASQSRGAVLALAVGLAVLLVARRLDLRALLAGAALAVGVLPSAAGDSTWWPAALGALTALVVLRVLPARVLPVVAVLAVTSAALLVAGHGNLSHRFSVASVDRAGELHGALADVRTHPLLGIGPGEQALRYTDSRGVHLDAYAHDEYVQVLWKTGAVGLVLLAVLLLLLVREALAGRRPDGPWTGCVAGLAALAVASSVDFLWHLPLIPLVGAVLAGVARPPFHTTQESP